jgi:peptide/nickel transport system substrate-binding protein
VNLSRFRRGQGEIANHVIDEFAAGRISRREFIRRGTVIGISIPVLDAILTACGSSATSTPARPSAAGKAGATIKAGVLAPSAAINPLTVVNIGGIDMMAQTGEYLTLSDQHLRLVPQLATKWSSNSAADVWMFSIRQGVKFHNGKPLTADDVVYTYKLNTDPKSAANALSAFAGALTPDGVRKVDSSTVAFHLESPNGNFPYLTSSDNYNMIILPDGYDPAKWESSFIGTGPFLNKSYDSRVGATFIRNPSYWGRKALPAKTEFTFYSAQTPQILALTTGTIDVVSNISVTGAEQLLAPGAPYHIIRLRSSAHRELSMRNDTAPFTDPRVRQAIALTLDRPKIVQALFKGYADLGNDSPFAPVYPSTNTSIPQRAKNIAKAKSLLAAAGHASGFATQLVTEQYLEIPQYAQIIVQSAQAIGVKINLKVETVPAYYGQAKFGDSDWLDAAMSLVDYAHRSVPNVFLTAPLETTNSKTGTGTWNAAHFADSQYDRLVAQYVAAVDLSAQRNIGGQIETLLLNETPIIYGYFYNYLTATARNVSGVYPTAIGHLFLYNATKG